MTQPEKNNLKTYQESINKNELHKRHIITEVITAVVVNANAQYSALRYEKSHIGVNLRG